MKLHSSALIVLIALFASLCNCDDDLRFASYYGDHMVLQRSPERAVLWGYGPDGARVTVSVTGPTTQTAQPVSVTQGVWRVTLEPVKAGGPYNVSAALKNQKVLLTDVLFGDIWLCGGQSNMAFTTTQMFNGSKELALASQYPQIRIFMVAKNLSETPVDDLGPVDLPWSVPTAGSLAQFSGICWVFGRYIYDSVKAPVGLVKSCWGGTPVEAWSSLTALQRCRLERFAPSPFYPQHKNAVLWNAMIHPLLKMTLTGAIWYQGESNVVYHQDQYSCSFPAMIDDWRTAFHQSSGGQTALDFPFGFVQLSTFEKDSRNEGFPNIRWHQTADVGFVPNQRMNRTFMAVAMDLPDESSPYGTIHPRYKEELGYRLSLGARAVAYGEKDVAFLGPFPKEISTARSYINVSYDQAVSVSRSDDIFELCCSGERDQCGTDPVWVPAPILSWELTSVQVSNGKCPSDKIAALRYAWRDWPCDFKACAIYSASRVLPAPPFKANL